MLRFKVFLLVSALGVADARLIASQMVIAQPVAVAVATSNNAAPSRKQVQRPLPMQSQDMQNTHGDGFWSWLGGVAKEAGEAFLLGFEVGVCLTTGLTCFEFVPDTSFPPGAEI